MVRKYGSLSYPWAIYNKTTKKQVPLLNCHRKKVEKKLDLSKNDLGPGHLLLKLFDY